MTVVLRLEPTDQNTGCISPLQNSKR